jgi:hypothetical protein
MATVAETLQARLTPLRAATVAAIEAKGVTVPAGLTWAQEIALILQIEGSTGPTIENVTVVGVPVTVGGVPVTVLVYS